MKEFFNVSYSEVSGMKRLPPRDQGHYLPFNSFPHGCPLGGFGVGTIGRSPFGDFNIWHIKVGAHIAEELKSCTFHSYQKQGDRVFNNLLTTRPYTDKTLEKFAKPFPENRGYYTASYPKAKYVFDDKHAPVEITCEQYSPIIPDNYRETSFPVAVFEHTLRNKTNEKAEASVMMSWANMTGWSFNDMRPGVQDNWFSFVKNNRENEHYVKTSKIGGRKLASVIMGQKKKKAEFEMDGEIALAVVGDAEVSTQPYFYLHGKGDDLCNRFYADGILSGQNPPRMMEHQNYGAAVAGKVYLEPGESKTVTFILVWDLPITHFGEGINRYKYYTKYFNKSGKNGWAIAQEAAKNHAKWSSEIDAWHDRIVTESKVAPSLKEKSRTRYFQMLVNELYFLSDGGTYWDAETGDFGLLECFDYPFYETLDVRFYGSFPILKFWPKIELKIMEDFAATINREYPETVRFHMHTDDPNLPLPDNKAERILCVDRKKVKGSCPHDLGSPKEEPFRKPAAYTWQNTNYWKDLNTKFVLLVYRNYAFTKDSSFLKKLWPSMLSATDFMLKMDKDGDGIPENSGYPDQTYDNWIMHGVSAYCGSLWIASLIAMVHAAKILKKSAEEKRLQKILEKAASSFEQKLWNGEYYDFCEGNTDIMADQLIGQWYCDILGETSVLPREHVKSALRAIYKNNFKGTVRGKWGVVSGKTKDNKMVDAEQGRDVWVGANFALATLFMKNGMEKEAQEVLDIMSEIIYRRGFFFRTPEGWDTEGQFTATMYMRPNAVWALEL